MPMTRPFRCLPPAPARPRAGGCGRICAMIGRPAVPILQRCCFAIHRIARVSGLASICSAFAASCKPMPMEVSTVYAIEDEIRGKLPDERKAVRQARAAPLLKDLYDWLRATVRKVSKKSAIASAIGYTLSLWSALTRYRDDGSIEIDNNPVERALRAVALGRKNYLFAGSDAGGERAAAFYSLIGTAKLCGLDPEAYLREVLTRGADHPVNRIEDLLPWNVAPQLLPSVDLAA